MLAVLMIKIRVSRPPLSKIKEDNKSYPLLFLRNSRLWNPQVIIYHKQIA